MIMILNPEKFLSRSKEYQQGVRDQENDVLEPIVFLEPGSQAYKDYAEGFLNKLHKRKQNES